MKKKKELRPYSFRVDAETDEMLAQLTAAVDEGVMPDRRRSTAIRDAIRVAWAKKFGK